MKGPPPPTAWPGLGSEGPSPQRPHPQAGLTCSLPACGWDLWALSAVPNVTGFSPSKTPSAPLPLPTAPSSSLPLGEGWARVQVLGQRSKVAGSRATDGGSLG